MKTDSKRIAAFIDWFEGTFPETDATWSIAKIERNPQRMFGTPNGGYGITLNMIAPRFDRPLTMFVEAPDECDLVEFFSLRVRARLGLETLDNVDWMQVDYYG